jgi:putative ABC transport system permease protein
MGLRPMQPLLIVLLAYGTFAHRSTTYQCPIEVYPGKKPGIRSVPGCFCQYAGGYAKSLQSHCQRIIRGTIIGVVKDFNYATLKEEVHPLILTFDSAARVLDVRARPGHAAESIAAVRHLWQQYDGAYPFSYSFLNEDFDKLYRADRRVGTLFDVFALITILISCLGLFGLATYSAQTRKKEIGVRRVLGAGVSHVAALLVRDFVGLIVLAFVIAAPAAGYLMEDWLHNYAYRTHLTVGIFAGTALIILTLALVTVCSQAVRAARANPVKSLRAE